MPNILSSLLPSFPGLPYPSPGRGRASKFHGATVHFASLGARSNGPIVLQTHALDILPWLDTPESLAPRLLDCEQM